MTFLTALGAFNYGLVLIYGLFLSAQIAGGWTNRQQKRLILILCPLFLLLQTPCWLMFGESITKQLYPLIVHLPLVLILIFALKKPVGIALVSVCTAYLCCQLPRWAELAVTAVPSWGNQLYTGNLPRFSASVSLFCRSCLQCYDSLPTITASVRQSSRGLLLL